MSIIRLFSFFKIFFIFFSLNVEKILCGTARIKTSSLLIFGFNFIFLGNFTSFFLSMDQ